MRRGRAAARLAVLALATAGLLGTFASGSASSTRAVAGARHSIEGPLPDGWRRSGARLVPLRMPREVLSVGTFPMPVGGGGNCGREPVAAIRRMRPGDALVSVQEYEVTASMRSRIGTAAAPAPLGESVGELQLRREPRVRGEPVAAGDALWSATLPFTDAGRWFDALVYVRGDPAPTRLRQVRSILESLRFGAR